jgi:anaerobic magnesium-protoporphyrin IX monomethyl ester cyclase
MRRAEAVAAEMAELKRTVAPDHIWFADDIFGLRPEWTAELGREVERLGAQIPFQIQSRVDLLSEAAVDGLVRAGCVEVWMGVESGSQRILDAMEKGIRVEHVPPAVERLRRRGIRACFFLQFGYPGETWNDILATVQLVRDILPDDIGISVTYPLPGTRFFDLVATQLGAKRHWTDSRDLAMMFQGTFTSELYRALHDLLHRELDLRHELTRATSPAGDTGPGSPEDARRGLAALQAEWDLLAVRARLAHSADPTRIVPPAESRPAPDLSRAAN